MQPLTLVDAKCMQGFGDFGASGLLLAWRSISLLLETVHPSDLRPVSGTRCESRGPPAEQFIQLTVQPAAERTARSALCVQVYFTQSVLRMKTMIKDEANPHHQHALQPRDRVCVFQVCVCVLWGWYSDHLDTGSVEAQRSCKNNSQLFLFIMLSFHSFISFLTYHLLSHVSCLITVTTVFSCKQILIKIHRIICYHGDKPPQVLSNIQFRQPVVAVKVSTPFKTSLTRDIKA